MRLFLIAISFFLVTSNVLAQKKEVEKSTQGIQLFFVNGLIVFNEFKVLDRVTLRTEVGLLTLDPFGDKQNLNLIYGIEPRYYLSLSESGRNSGLYASFNFMHLTSDFTINRDPRRTIEPQIIVGPMLGYRKSFKNKLNFEIGAGVGYGYEYYNHYYKGQLKTFERTTLPKLNLRIGYSF